MQAFSESWRPRGGMLVLAEVAYTATDPPIKAVRRVLPPLRMGSSRSTSAGIVMFGVIILMYLALASTV